MEFNQEEFVEKLFNNPEELKLEEMSICRKNVGDEAWQSYSEYIVEELVRRLRLINRAWGFRGNQ